MTRFQVGLYQDLDLAPSCRARGPHVCVRYPLRPSTEGLSNEVSSPRSQPGWMGSSVDVPRGEAINRQKENGQ